MYIPLLPVALFLLVARSLGEHAFTHHSLFDRMDQHHSGQATSSTDRSTRREEGLRAGENR